MCFIHSITILNKNSQKCIKNNKMYLKYRRFTALIKISHYFFFCTRILEIRTYNKYVQKKKNTRVGILAVFIIIISLLQIFKKLDTQTNGKTARL